MLGALQGMTKQELSTKYGECQLQLWTNAFDIPPPALDLTDPMMPECDPRYAVSRNFLFPCKLTKPYLNSGCRQSHS